MLNLLVGVLIGILIVIGGVYAYLRWRVWRMD
jgi:hypothetical protein